MFLYAAIVPVICIASMAVRVFLGPTIPDRLVGTDAISNLVVVAMVLIGTALKMVIYIDVAIVYALLSFVTTLFVAKYLEKGEF
jgi:multicomponent Na+:H+ antiporter subunit F